MNKTIPGTACALLAAVLLTGCGGGGDHAMSGGAPSAAPSAAAAHDDADVSFAQEMIPHHRQAVAMAQLASSRGSNAQVKELAGRIEQAQAPEIQQMTAWLNRWGAAPGGAMPSMAGMPGGAMPGMMTDAQMRQLGQASGADFDTMFLQMMISHHQGAVAMAGTELSHGADPDAQALARRISASQTAEITEMRGLLAAL